MFGHTRGPISLPTTINGDSTLYSHDTFATGTRPIDKLKKAKSTPDIPFDTGTKKTKSKKSDRELFKYIQDNVIGADTVFTGPFGKRKGIYYYVLMAPPNEHKLFTI